MTDIRSKPATPLYRAGHERIFSLRWKRRLRVWVSWRLWEIGRGLALLRKQWRLP